MNILAIETSCDETALSIISSDSLDTNEPNFKVLSDLVISQIPLHQKYGGVFPALAKREHAKNLVPLFIKSLEESQLYEPSEQGCLNNATSNQLHHILEREPELLQQFLTLFNTIHKPNIDMVMITHGPGLAPALWVGVNFAKALALVLNIPILPVNHMEGHISSILLKNNYSNQEQALLSLNEFSFPLLALLISGGHTQLVLVKNWGDYEIIGETIDDAVGEAFDKVARMLGMEYPGGPHISRAAEQGVQDDTITLPRPMITSKDYRFSFSGLKTAVRYLIEDIKTARPLDQQTISNISREFEYAVTDVLIKKTSQAIEEFNIQGLIIAGGVSANKFITEQFKEVCSNYSIPLYLPHKKLCGDNSLMIASAGFINYWKNNTTPPIEELSAQGNLKL